MRNLIRPTWLDLHDLAAHFLALSSGDRFLRFGRAMTDTEIVAYVDALLATDDTVWAVVEPDADISGVLHLQFGAAGARLGLSVSAWARDLGVGTLLLHRAALLACQQGVTTLYVRKLGFNGALRQLALRLGMGVVCARGNERSSRDFRATSRSLDPMHEDVELEMTLADAALLPAPVSGCRDAPAGELAAHAHS